MASSSSRFDQSAPIQRAPPATCAVISPPPRGRNPAESSCTPSSTPSGFSIPVHVELVTSNVSFPGACVLPFTAKRDAPSARASAKSAARRNGRAGSSPGMDISCSPGTTTAGVLGWSSTTLPPGSPAKALASHNEAKNWTHCASLAQSPFVRRRKPSHWKARPVAAESASAERRVRSSLSSASPDAPSRIISFDRFSERSLYSL